MKITTTISMLAMLTVTRATGVDFSNSETIGLFAGQILGGAKLCGVADSRINTVRTKVFAVINARAANNKDAMSATHGFANTYLAGAQQVLDGADCAKVQVTFQALEQRLALCKSPYTGAC
jgi:hypothetical protein